MLGLPLVFAYPLVLSALVLLPAIWFLLRLTPPKPREEVFPPLAILRRLVKREETPARSPWWLTALRLLMAALAILAMAGPVWNPREAVLNGDGNLILVIDDGWASGNDWADMRALAGDALDEAASASRTVSLVRTTSPFEDIAPTLEPEAARRVLDSHENIAAEPDHEDTARKLRELAASGETGEILFLSDGLEHPGTRELAAFMSGSGLKVAIARAGDDLAALSPLANAPEGMRGTVLLPQAGESTPFSLTGRDQKGLPVARTSVVVPDGEKSAEFNFTEPLELRNQIASVSIEGMRNPGAVQLLDDSNRRRIVGLVSGQSADVTQPLLSPLYYIERALSPFSDIRDADTANIEEAVTGLINQNVSAIIMADVGNLPEDTTAQLQDWLAKGGMLIRFAGPRLAANPEDALLPVRLLQGDRFIGGALSWEEPKGVAEFEQNSPFFGLEPPAEVQITRQVMALQSRDLDEHTWARLEDGTPLVTAGRSGNGWLVLFHVNSDNNWSNLPLSGTFVEMLRRIVDLSRSTLSNSELNESISLPPMEILDGSGTLVPPPAGLKPLEVAAGTTPVATVQTPAGLYGTENGYVAVNVLNSADPLVALDTASFAGARSVAIGEAGNTEIRPWLIALAALLFLADCIAVLWFAGAMSPASLRRATRHNRVATATALAAVLLTGLLVLAPGTAFSQSAPGGNGSPKPELDYQPALTTHLAYVITGIDEVDRVSKLGLEGLTRYIASRTAFEPGAPVGVDVASDELAFYPLLYWPIHANSPVPGEATMARVDAFMKQGGSILFDTRNQISSLMPGSNAPENVKLRQILATLDIPPLEPVPPDHVLTKAFYLLDSFPGRYAGGDLWVEQLPTSDELDARPARAGDGVSTILITSNDFAAAWAVDENLRPLFQTVPPNPRQRELAFRSGVNIAMYALTGNYKADQVHIPALLERLGQ
ncbi:MAG: DUF4159 domain-containing protein [Nitratireductor sp.]|nr:DUF4159 domain-containing protein [Nitratireductor sp.]MCC0022114.1 DUF4159 domain-containing protein [Nitratireductor sp.]